jgi:hypothetical protein
LIVRPLVPLVLILAACGARSPIEVERPFRSGTRLRAHVAHGGAAQLFLGWRDTQLGADCAFTAASDGRIRCLPTTTVRAFFLDASCTQRAVAVPTCAEPPRWVVEQSGGCDPVFGARDAPSIVRALGAEQTAKALYSMESGRCARRAALPDTRIFAAGDVVDPGIFVAATVEDVPRDARLSARTYVGEDRSIQPAGIVDAELGPCRPPPVGVEDSLCLPTSLAWSIGHVAAGCGEPAAYTQARCPPPRAIVKYEAGGCVPGKLSIFEVGAVTEGHRLEGAQCKTLGESDHVHYRLGAEVAPSTFAMIKVQRHGGRLQTTYLSTISGAPLLPLGRLHDTARDVDCDPMRFEDGTVRCVAIDTPIASGLFADEGCEQPAVERIVDACGRPPSDVAVTFARSASACDVPRASLWSIGEPLTRVFIRDGARCMAVTTDGSTDLRALGGPADPAHYFTGLRDEVD